MLSKTDMETLDKLGYDRPTLLKLVAFDIERKGKYLLNLIEPAPIGTRAQQEAIIAVQKQLRDSKLPPKRTRAAKPNGAPAQTAKPKTQGGKRTLTPEARANIIAAQKKRWADYHEAQAVG